MAVEYKGKKIAMSVKIDAPPTEEKTVALDMANGNQVVSPTEGKSLLKVTVQKPDTMLPANIKKDVNIGGVVGTLEEKEEQEKTARIGANGTTEVTPASGKTLSKVTIITNVPSKPEQEKSVTITKNGTTEVTPDNALYALSKVTVTANVKPTLQSKTITPTKSAQNVTPDSSYDGLSKVTVNAIPDDYVIPSGSQDITTNGTYDITNKASVVVAVPSYQPTLNAPSISLSGSTLTITNPSTNGNFVTSYKVYKGGTLLTTITATMLDLSTLITAAGTYSITVKASGTNFNDSNASSAITYTLQGQTTPVISLVSGTTIQIDTIDDNAQTIEVYTDGTKIGEVAKQ